MRKWTFVFAVALAACSGKMPPGPTGRPMELRKYLPDSLKTAPFPPDSTYRQEIVVGPDSARVELTWTTFRHGTGWYLSSISARLVQPVRYDSLTLGEVSELTNIGSKPQPIESAKIGVLWFKTRFFAHTSGVTPFAFGANGRRVTWSAMGK